MEKRSGRRVLVQTRATRLRSVLLSAHALSFVCVLLLVVGAVALVVTGETRPTSADSAAHESARTTEAPTPDESVTTDAVDDSAQTGVSQRKLQKMADSRAKSIDALRVKAMGVAEELSTPTAFRLQSYNVLGSGHTVPGGTASGFASGRQRAAWTRDVIARLGSDVVGFQEVFEDQYAVLRGGLPHFSWFPGTTYGDEGLRASIGWDSRQFSLVDSGTLRINFIRQYRRLPYVKLEDRKNGRQFWFFNIHNAPRDLQAQRNENLAAEISVIRQLEKDGIPIFMAGDFNENRDAISGPTSLQRAPGSLHIEQIYGSPGTLQNFVVHRDAQTRRATDHRVPYSDVVID